MTNPVNRIANLRHVAELAIRVLGPHRGAAARSVRPTVIIQCLLQTRVKSRAAKTSGRQ
jgi:hypothetical protein